MNDVTSRFLGALVIVMGVIALASYHDVRRLRGVAYIGYGIFMIGRTFKVRNER